MGIDDRRGIGSKQGGRYRLLSILVGLLLVFGAVTAVPAGAVLDTESKLAASDGVAGDELGQSIAVSGDTMVVGASSDDSQRGAAYVYTRVGDAWLQQQRLVASNRGSGDEFGYAVGISGDTLVVGAYADDGWTGAAYVFTRTAGVWSEQQILTASDGVGYPPTDGDHFGWSVAISGDTVIVGAFGDDSWEGSAYVFTRTAGVWSEQQKLTASDGAAFDQFGVSVAVEDDTVVVGAYEDDIVDGVQTDDGAAYVFTRTAGVWSEQQKLTASGTSKLGYSVGVSADTAVVGSDQGGSAYVFTRSVGVWSEEQVLSVSGENLKPVGVSGDTVVAGAPGADTYTGAAYVFTRSGGAWFEQLKLTASDGAADDSFGFSVAVSGEVVGIGAKGDDSLTGSAYVFEDTTAPIVFVHDDITVAAEGADGTVIDFSSRVGAFADGMVWEHLAFSYSENSFVRNPGSYNSHIEFRKAVAHAIDRDALVDAIPGASVVVDSYVDGYWPIWSQRAWSQYPYDPAMTAYWLEVLCAKPGVDCVANSPTVVFTTTSGNSDRAILTDMLETMLKDSGIGFVAELESSVLFFGDTFNSGEWDVGEWAWGAGGGVAGLVEAHDSWDPDAPLPYGFNVYRYGTPTVSGEAPPFNQGPGLLSNAASIRMAELVDLMDATTDPAVWQPLVAEAENLLADELVFLPLYARPDPAVVSGVTCDPPSGSLFPLGETTVTCTASDASGNEGSSGFAVTVLGVTRYAGSNRYGTAAATSAGDFPDPGEVDRVFIAVGTNFPDALAGAAVAGKLGAPLLLVASTAIPTETATELARLAPDEIVILGGTAVIDPGVESALGAYAPTVTRLAGSNRYATAVEISQYGFAGTSFEVVIATGTGFADALAGGPLAVAHNGPVLLTDPNSLPAVVAAEITRLAPTRIVVVGGTSAVTAAVFAQLQAIQANTVRLSGANRYDTAVAISQDGFGEGATRAYVATGLNFPDALAGAAAAGWWEAPVLLVPGSSVPASVSAEIDRLGASHVIVLGGTAVVTSGVATSLGILIGL